MLRPDNTRSTSARKDTASVKTFAFSDRTASEECAKILKTVVQLCDNERLGLKTNPPYILTVLPSIAKHLMAIQDTYAHDLQLLDDNDYLRLFIDNLTNKCNCVVQLFKDGGDEMFKEKSLCRKELAKVTLALSHMDQELQAMFPASGCRYVGQEYCMLEPEANTWWHNEFGDRLVVAWTTFKEHLLKATWLKCSFDINPLKTTIDLTDSQCVSIFELNVFVSLFRPWTHVMQNWRFFTQHPAYLAFGTYDEAIARLQKCLHKPGSFVYRQSCTKLGQWAIAYVTPDGSVLQSIPRKPLAIALNNGRQKRKYLYPDGKEFNGELPSYSVG